MARTLDRLRGPAPRDPRRTRGGAAYACVIGTAGTTVTEEEPRALVSRELSEYQTPRTVEFVEAPPLTEVGNVGKKALRARRAAAPEAR